MNKRNCYLALVALIVLVAPDLACTAGHEPAEAPTFDDQVATSVAQTLEAVPTATATQIPTLLPTDTPTPVPPTAEPEPTPTPEPTPEPTATREVTGLKDELFVYGMRGAGGDETPPCESVFPSLTTELPAIGGAGRMSNYSPFLGEWETGILCLFGFPRGEVVTVSLYAPNGDFAGSHAFETDSFWVSEIEGITAFQLLLWWPAGLPIGEWYAVATSASAYAEGPFEVEAVDRPVLSILPESGIDVFKGRSSWSPDSNAVLVCGISFEPNTELALGVYSTPPGGGESRFDERGEEYEVLTLSHSRWVTTDSQGSFTTTFSIDSSFPAGGYITIPSPDSNFLYDGVVVGF